MTSPAAGAAGRAPRRSVADLEQRIYECLDLGQLLSVLAAELGAVLPVKDRVSIALLESDGEWLRVHRLLPQPPEEQRGTLPRVRVEGTPVGQVVTGGAARVVADTRADPNITFGQASHDGIRSTVSVPIRVGGRVVGAMNAGSRTPGACDEDMLRQLAEVAAVVGPAVFAADRVARRAPVALESDGDRPAGLVGQSSAFRSLLAAARRAAASNADVLITGETGVGKTALARAMHGWSPRSGGPFVTVHLADLTPTLIESELFGHERGAFTGASSHRVGRFESARGGTILLDEVSETPPAIQAKLLRVVQDRSFERVGGARTMQADVRIIAATSRDLRAAIRRGEFREDLFYRLNVVPLGVPPLRDRPDDLELLVDSILAGIHAVDRTPRRLSADAWTRLRAHGWPGNIRELESVLRRAAILEEGPELELEGFPDPAYGGGDPAAGDAPDAEGWPCLEEHERRYILRVLEELGGVIEGPSGAAQLLGLHPSTLRSLMKRLGITAQPARQRGRR